MRGRRGSWFIALSSLCASTLCLAAPAGAALSRGLCRSNSDRGSIPQSFAVRACFDGTKLYVRNNLDVALGVATSGSVGSPHRTESNYNLEVDVTRLRSKDPNVLLPGDTLAFPIGSGGARIKLRGTSTTSFYFLAATVAHFFPIPKVGGLAESFATWLGELDADGHQYLDCERSASLVHRLGCKALLVRNIGFANARFIVHGALTLAKSNLGKILSTALGLIEGASWANTQPSQVKTILHSGTISLRAATLHATLISRQNPVTAGAAIAPGFSVSESSPTGKCEGGSEVGQAYRCFTEHHVLDPCFAIADPLTGDGTGVACPLSPFSNQLYAITSATGLGILAPDSFDQPNGIVLASGTHCVEAQGAHSADTAGRIVDYYCDDNKTVVLRGLHETGALWRADIATIGSHFTYLARGAEPIASAVLLQHDVPPANPPVTDAGNATASELDAFAPVHHEADCGAEGTVANSSTQKEILVSQVDCSEATLIVVEWDNSDALEPGWTCSYDENRTLLCEKGVAFDNTNAPAFFSSPHLRALSVG
jgi:hypothetical protein